MVKKRNEAGARDLSPEGSAAEAKRMRRQTAKDDRARRRRTGGTPSRAQGVRQRSGGADRAAGAGRPKGCLFCCDQRSPGCVGRARRSLVRRTGRTPPPSPPPCPPRLGSPWSRDETLPGTGPLQRRSNAKGFARRCTNMGKTAKISGTVTVPGDKSISHRAVMFASMAEGQSRIRGFLPAEDTLRTVGMMIALGVEIHEISPTEIRVNGRGMRGCGEPQDIIDAGNSGTTIRIGCGILAAQPFVSIVTGDPYLRRRPMGRIVRPLTRMGARITGRRENTLPPLCIEGGGLRGIRYEMPVASAPVKSSILLAGPHAGDR